MQGSLLYHFPPGFLFYVCGCFPSLFVCALQVCLVPSEDQNRVSDPVVGHHGSAGNQNEVLKKSSHCF